MVRRSLDQLDQEAVSKTGDETIAGVKTFSSTINGSINGNAGTATKLATARALKIGNSSKTLMVVAK